MQSSPAGVFSQGGQEIAETTEEEVQISLVPPVSGLRGTLRRSALAGSATIFLALATHRGLRQLSKEPVLGRTSPVRGK